MSNPPCAPDSWSRSLELAVTPDDLWDLMWRPETQAGWLGPGAPIALEAGVRCSINDEAGSWRTGRILSADAPVAVRIKLDPAASWGIDRPATSVTLRIEPAGERRSTLAIEEIEVQPQHLAEVAQFWERRLGRLAGLVGRVGERRSKTRQAVVVIHGIGEQQPGTTLRSLVKSGVVPSVTDPGSWVKPDARISSSFELRRITFQGSDIAQLPTTDFFEYYWAHLIRDTTIGQVAGWVRRLLFRPDVPKPLRPLWFLAGLVFLVIVGVAVAAWVNAGTVVAGGVGLLVLGAAARLLWRFIGLHLAVQVLGDAARYLMPLPANIAHRQAIREAGVDLIERLHRSGRYDRIVILGHSLGSVIAYDIVTNAWTRMNSVHLSPRTPGFEDLRTVEREVDETDVDRAQRIQHAAWRRQRVNTQPWLITDLVTVGSPLTYADLLIAASHEGFELSKRDRVTPACPPVTELERKSGHRRVTYDRPYTDAFGNGTRTFTVFHHAAPFAVTRWTNLYFKVGRLGLRGDLIGGPVAPQFGEWVRDVPLDPPARGKTHSAYWRRARSAAGKQAGDDHIEALRMALHLDSRVDLISLLNEIPGFALLGDDDED